MLFWQCLVRKQVLQLSSEDGEVQTPAKQNRGVLEFILPFFFFFFLISAKVILQW